MRIDDNSRQIGKDNQEYHLSKPKFGLEGLSELLRGNLKRT